MKHLTHKLAVSFLITSVALPSVNANFPIHESSGVPLSTSVVAQTLNKHKDPTLNSSAGIFNRLSTGDAKIEAEILSGATLHKKSFKIKKLYKKLIQEYKILKAEFEALSESEKQLNAENATLNELIKQLNIENADLKTEQEKYNAEQRSSWQQFKDWVSKLDVTKVTTTLVTGLITIISTLLIILM